MELDKTIEDMAYEALNCACLHIQTQLKVDTGDYASMYFSDNEVHKALEHYIEDEIRNKINEYQFWLMTHSNTAPDDWRYAEIKRLSDLLGGE